ncbi:MAG TPA: hypothetical protein EYP71_04350, partial [Dehalococcoidia bacterium]|nr:hypothetical protein [Dehalococcoidia bacterium]
MDKQKEEYIVIPITLSLPCRFSAGPYMGRFLREFKQKRILGVKCPSCGRTFVPPRQMCGRCHTETCEWVELKDTGTLLYYDIVYYEFIDPTTGEKKPVPWVHGPIQLDGSDGDVVVDEIALNPTHFKERTMAQTLSTLVHEMCHLWQHHFGKPPRGNYHNKQWATKMLSCGLIPSDTGREGGKQTGQNMTHYIEDGGVFDT